MKLATPLALCLLAAPLAAQGAPQVTDLVVFGDSLSDDGNYHASTAFPPPPYWQGRFSDGRVWAEQLANHLGLSADTIQVQAVGFATTADVLSAQVLPWLTANGAADPDALYTYWAGANDLFGLLSNGGDPQVVIGGAMQNTAGALLALMSSGARRIVVANLPDLSLTPFARDLPAPVQAQILQLTMAYNAALAQTLATLEAATGADFVEVDAFGLIQAIDLDPWDYGFKHADQRALSPEGVVARRVQDYLFWDHVHPTTRGHSQVVGLALAQLGVLWGDVDADGAVTGLDVAALVRAFGPSQPGNPADMDGDGEVDLDDLSLLHTALR
jgi:phospholipase/lecithinase/hemolysin